MSDYYTRGKAAVSTLWKNWSTRPEIDDPRHPDFSAGVLDAIIDRLEHSDDVDKEIRRYSEAAAEQVTSASRTIFEIIQNADDLGASKLNLSVRRSGAGEFLAVHNGGAVEAAHVIAMALAFLSLKRDDPKAKGRFGIGLKTLNQVGSRLAVHSPPYHFEIANGNIRKLDPQPAIRGLYSNDGAQTLLAISLDREFTPDDVTEWIDKLGSKHLLFLDAIREITYVTAQGNVRRIASLNQTLSEAVEIELRPGQVFTAKKVELTDNENSWSRYSVLYPVPKAQKRTHKATGEITELSVAIPNQSSSGTLYAGLPLDITASLPVDLNAQFDPDLSRRGLQDRAWNRWLFERLSEVVSGIALKRFEEDPKTGWQAVPLLVECNSNAAWEKAQITNLTLTAQARVKARARLYIDDEEVGFDNLVYPGVGLSSLLTDDDLRSLSDNHFPLPKTQRDKKARWRNVLDEIANGLHIDIDDALRLLDFDDDKLGARNPYWFVNLANKALAEGLEHTLNLKRCLLASSGERYAPIGDRQFVRHSRRSGLASGLDLEVELHPIYFDDRTPIAVRDWVQKRCAQDHEHDLLALEALSRTDPEQPIALEDDAVVSIRNTLQSLDDDKRDALAKKIGKVVLVDGFEFYRGKKKQKKVRPSEAYLPTQIAKDTGGWAAAAKTTPQLLWIDHRYANLLKGAAGSDLGAKKFFILLGARAGPRLIRQVGLDRSVAIPAEIPAMQADAVNRFRYGSRPTHLSNDWISPDLDRVIADIVKQKVDARRRQRSRALFETLSREWEYYFEDKSQSSGEYFYYVWRVSGAVPATWLANCASQPWLSSKSNRKVAPREIAIETAATRLTKGDHRSNFVSEISETDAQHPLIKALEIEGTPSTAELLDSLRELKSSSTQIPKIKSAVPYYVSLAGKVRGERPRQIGEMEIDRFRAAFEQEQLLLTHLGWKSPSDVYRSTRAIFGKYRGFVTEDRILEPLWDQLHIEAPTINSSIEVLTEIASVGGSPDQHTSAVIVDTLRLLAEKSSDLSKKQEVRLASLPLWTSLGWETERPIFLMDDVAAIDSIEAKVPIWKPGCSIESLGGIPEKLGVARVGEESFKVDPTLEVDSADEATSIFFAATLRELKNELEKKGDSIARRLNWGDLAKIKLFHAPALAAFVELNGKRFNAERDIFMSSQSELYFRSDDCFRDPAIAARFLAHFGNQPISEMTGYVWVYLWSQVESGVLTEPLGLAEDQHDNSVDSIAAILAAGKNAKGAKITKRKSSTDNRRGLKNVGPRPKPRALKTFENAEIGEVSISSSGTAPVKAKKPKKRLLKDPKSRLPKATAEKPPALKEWGEKEREKLGFELLASTLNTIDQAYLEDFSAIHQVGADSIDDLKRYWELKVYAGEAPDEVRFEASEFERAAREKGDYYLAVISGLEEGKQTEIRLFSDPLRTLKWRSVSRLRLSGIRSHSGGVLIPIKTKES